MTRARARLKNAQKRTRRAVTSAAHRRAGDDAETDGKRDAGEKRGAKGCENWMRSKACERKWCRVHGGVKGWRSHLRFPRAGGVESHVERPVGASSLSILPVSSRFCVAPPKPRLCRYHDYIVTGEW